MLNTHWLLVPAVVLAFLASATTAAATTGAGTPIPEPSLVVLLAAGVGGAILYVRNRNARR